jgi:hypothetical protein
VGETLSEAERQDRRLMQSLRIKSREEPLRLYPSDFPELNAGPDGAKLMSVVQIINRMLEPSPDRRYRSAVEILADIETQLGDLLQEPPRGRSRTESPVASHAGGAAPVDPRQTAIEARWESAVRLSNWSDAEHAARDLVELSPQRADGHLLLGETALRQADSLAAAGGRPQVLANLRGKARRWLQEGLERAAPAEQPRLCQRLAHVCRLLNDDQAADLWLSRSR